jgi:hypothetical protein
MTPISKPIAIDDPRLVFQPLEVEVPAGLVFHYKDCYWVYQRERGLALWRARPRDPLSPQCNKDERVTRLFIEKIYPWAEVWFCPSVFVKSDPADWRD